jgi:CDP-diacylglycerol--glycerol-3-phosphate 3-phosphatidyltransferase
MNIPNLLTLLRLILIPVCVIIYYLPFDGAYVTTAVLFTIAAITDWFDGYLARKWNQTTPFGAFLDPVADKLIVAAALVILVESHHTIWLTIPAVIIIGREIVISALREWMAELGSRSSVAVNKLGKIKTTVQMIAIVVLLSQVPGTFLSSIGLVSLQAASVLTLWSMIVYLKAAWGDLKPKAS